MIDDLRRNESFFLRNAYWENLDTSVRKGDYGNVVFYVDRLLPLVDSSAEKKNLLLIKEDAKRRAEGLPWGCISVVVIVLV